MIEDDGEEKKRARKGKDLIDSPPLRRKKRRAKKGNAKVADYGSVEESITMGKRFQSNMTKERLASLRAEFKILELITLRAPWINERSFNVQGDDVAVYMDRVCETQYKSSEEVASIHPQDRSEMLWL